MCVRAEREARCPSKAVIEEEVLALPWTGLMFHIMGQSSSLDFLKQLSLFCVVSCDLSLPACLW